MSKLGQQTSSTMKKKKDEITIYVKKVLNVTKNVIFEIRTDLDSEDMRQHPFNIEVLHSLASKEQIDAYQGYIETLLYHRLRDQPQITKFRILYDEETYSNGGINGRNNHWSYLYSPVTPEEILNLHSMISKAAHSIKW